MIKPCLASHPEYVDGCTTCKLWLDPRYANAVDLVASPRPVPSARLALPVLAPCAHEGRVVEYCKTCSNGDNRHVRFCLHPSPSDEDRDTCTRQPVSNKVQACSSCPDYTPSLPVAANELPVQKMVWVSTARLAADSLRLGALLPASVKGVAGIPRSGMIPASIIATQLHLPLYELQKDGTFRPMGHGARGRGMPALPGPIAVIDDTVYTGRAIRDAKDAVKDKRTVFTAVYCRPRAARWLDTHAVALESPHLLEWNVANSRTIMGDAINPIYGKGVAFDIDGIIVHDEHSGGRPGSPYLVPRLCEAPLLATGRREAERERTESLLRSLGARWKRLDMLPNDRPPTVESIAAHKAEAFERSGCGFFIESEPKQAEAIHALTKKPVICPRTDTVWGSCPT